MKLGKIVNGEIQIISIKSEEELNSHLEKGYELISETYKPSDTARANYVRISNGWIEDWIDDPQD